MNPNAEDTMGQDGNPIGGEPGQGPERDEGGRSGGMDAPAGDGPEDMEAPGPDTERSGGSSNH
jgi:hypothetical protein